MGSVRPLDPVPLFKKTMLRINDTACQLPGQAVHEQAVSAAVTDAYNGRRSPDVLAYDRFGYEHYSHVAAELLDGLDLIGRTVLDIGCGVGILTRELLAAGAGRVICVDLCAGMLDACRQRIVQSGLDERACTFLQSHAASLPLPDSSVDVIVSSLTLGLLPHPETLAGELARVLRPGGQVSLAAQGARYLLEFQNALIQYVPLRYQLGYPTAFWPMTSRDAKRLCSGARLCGTSIRHAYWQDDFPNPDDAFAFTAAAGASFWATAIPDHAIGAIKERIRQHFNDRRILRVTQDVVYIRARKAAGPAPN